MIIAGAKGRRARYSEEMRQDILQAAREIIAEEGAGALSIRGIARRIGYSAPALYEYFDGKEAIAEALFVAGFQQLAEMMGAVAHPDPLTRLRALGIVYHQFALTHPQEYSLMFSRPIPEFRPSEEDLKIAATAFAPLQHTFEDGIAAGVIRPMEARTGATATWAYLHGLVSLELAGMSGPPPGHPLPARHTLPGHFPSMYETALDLFGDAIRAH
ncbi:MAG: TetR/AcrR family transcriptional regulator [Thermomicrobiales bacterium]